LRKFTSFRQRFFIFSLSQTEMSDRPKRIVQQKDKTKEKDNKDEPVDKNTPQKSTQQSTMLPTPESKASSSRMLLVETVQEKEKESKDEPTQTLQEDELSQALGTLKRKQEEDDGLLILQEKVKILKLAKEITGQTDATTNSNEFNFRLSKISKMLTFYPPDAQEERTP
jgi:outer membrane biosynthesis protein TonB